MWGRYLGNFGFNKMKNVSYNYSVAISETPICHRCTSGDGRNHMDSVPDVLTLITVVI